ncbi:HAD family hydrolase [Sphingomonas bacterium]|uniref:HAD family hydrolase n=1 Tax=Sphingomonas bacterium TaxID=1895847 RepID=UPI0015752F6B|nr:HAD family hydrolase [Sphingomonas bacterium]
MACKAVFFDIDGTLVDSNGLHVEAWQRAFAEAGHDIANEAIAGQIGKGADNLVPALIPGSDDDAAEALGDRHGAIFKGDCIDRARAFPHARDLILRVHDAGLRIILASSASEEELKHYCDLLDIGDLVDVATTIDDVGTSKPAPDIFAVARDKAGIDAADVVVVGDAPYDMDAARKCGMVRVAVRSGGFADDALFEAGAQTIYDDVADLLAGFDASPLAR